MDLYVIRHGIAEEGEDDAARSLTGKGRRRLREVVHGLARLDVRIGRVLHSPKRRAVQTAELLAPVVDGGFEVTPLLAEAPGPALLELLREGQSTAVVGHQPYLSQLVAWLTTGDTEVGAAFPLKKGGLAALMGEPVPAGMQLSFLATPRLLRGEG